MFTVRLLEVKYNRSEMALDAKRYLTLMPLLFPDEEITTQSS